MALMRWLGCGLTMVLLAGGLWPRPAAAAPATNSRPVTAGHPAAWPAGDALVERVRRAITVMQAAHPLEDRQLFMVVDIASSTVAGSISIWPIRSSRCII